jgi:hypothetical protein
MAVPLKAISLLESRIVTVPPPFWIPVPLLVITLSLTFTSMAESGPSTSIPAVEFPENTERLSRTLAALLRHVEL